MTRLKIPIKKEIIFKIRVGDKRRKKKKLNNLKSFVKTFWCYENINRIYGSGMSDKEYKYDTNQKNHEVKCNQNNI